MEKKIDVINLGNLPTIPLKDLKENFESNSLKQKENRDIGDLKTSILTIGFNFPFFIWVEGKYIVDGTGRLMALELLEYEGYEIPDLPYIPISAKNKKEAKRLTLLASSEYGKKTNESVGEFTYDLTEIDLGFVSLEGYNMEEIEWTPPKAKEIDIDKMKGETKMQHTCPKCKFKFSTK